MTTHPGSGRGFVRRCSLSKVSYRYAHIEDLDAPTIYALLRLRQEVFIVEWGSSHLDIDGRDTEPSCLHLWAERDSEVLAALRVVAEPDGSLRIERLATRFGARGRGIAGRLLDYAVKMAGELRLLIDVPIALELWAERFGFTRTGDPFLAEGIQQVTMAHN
jgi:ElaA protein